MLFNMYIRIYLGLVIGQRKMKNIKEAFKKNYVWIIFAVALIIFLVILEDVFEDEIMRCDTISYNIVINYLRADWLTPIVKVITACGGARVLLTLSLLSLFFVKRKRIALCITANLFGITALNLLLKTIIQRPRPDGYRLVHENGYSFPSGHSMVSTAFYGLIIYFIYKNIKNKKLRNVLCALIGALIFLIGSSRIYLGVHYASDVIAGFFTSIAYLIIVIKIITIIKTNKKEKAIAKISQKSF